MFQGIIRGKKQNNRLPHGESRLNGIPLRDELNSDARQLPSIPYRDTITLSLDRAGHHGLGERQSLNCQWRDLSRLSRPSKTFNSLPGSGLVYVD